MSTEKKTRRKYTEEFKRDAVALVTEQGYKVSQAAQGMTQRLHLGLTRLRASQAPEGSD